ncbi:Alcohol dehydrogenase transcription factor Myb/SANT-like [Popillia japonica]|uniref:Alcohol dehydrogenase transcription factor Myb/SANT-like n=1 Tax=Popillia japonica TaxID=7064 RepID=A0AAW1IET9_POPJA
MKALAVKKIALQFRHKHTNGGFTLFNLSSELNGFRVDTCLTFDVQLKGKQVFKMAASRWTEEKSRKFITVYENYECLWNTKSSAYKNRDARGAAVRKLISDMEELGIKMTEDEVRNRIKAIRTTYMSELRKVEKAAR